MDFLEKSIIIKPLVFKIKAIILKNKKPVYSFTKVFLLWIKF
ncbi:hypothetical protein HMPREF9193_01867 [Treponema lecithinolyticum ATCC 700332]|uniref:Uncharacterized protein n=1 Tax=Treponema lecithinolyticum ATCC 700332 TaxID=1321815 RepID=A0ABN0NX04_TRELE|nr:hypothetical protein HMPREF9193_01867 [Treponema lecithinolyticum ATCC 700332]